MNFKQLEALIYVARHGTFKKAAESLYFDSSGDDYITPESIQYRLKQLEQDLGVSLYRKRRGSARVQLTREGQMFLNEAVDVYQRMCEWKGIFLDSQEGILTFATTQAVLIHRLLPTIKKFREIHPKLRLKVLNCPDDDVLERALIEGKLDFAFSTRPPDTQELEYVFWKRSRMVLLTPKDHPLSKRKSVSLIEIIEEPLVVLNPDVRGDRDLLNREFLRIGAQRPNIVMETSNSEIITAYVEAGVGLGITSETSTLNQPRAVSSVPISDLMNRSEVGLLTRRGQYITWRAREFLSLADPVFEQWLQQREAAVGSDEEELPENGKKVRKTATTSK